jgi:hypothetical protein
MTLGETKVELLHSMTEAKLNRLGSKDSSEFKSAIGPSTFERKKRK